MYQLLNSVYAGIEKMCRVHPMWMNSGTLLFKKVLHEDDGAFQ